MSRKKVREEITSCGASSTNIVMNGAKPTAGVIREENYIENKIGESENARLEFFDNFFSEDNKMRLGRVMVYGGEIPRRYTIVRFSARERYGEWLYEGWNYEEFLNVKPDFAPIPIAYPTRNVEEYLRFLYTKMADEVEYFEGIVDEEFQAIIKALYVDGRNLVAQELKISDYSNYGVKEIVTCLTDERNALYWLKDDVVPVINPEYLKAFKQRYMKKMEGSVNVPDFKSLYAYFKENPHPDMKVLKLENASENPFRFL
ncbi:MAG: hypothetical protein K2G03_03340 [Bacilli bacterium]|nr:hypothetical protein [Bacilli bacterium]